MTKRKKYQPSGKVNDPALTHMREVAFGTKAYFETKAVLERAERMRNDDDLLAQAEIKRQRKMAKRLGK
jgi:hypothetical protein